MAVSSKPKLYEPSQSRPLPEIDTVWFDVSALLLMPSGYVSGITRTIHKIIESWGANPWTRTRFCAFVPDEGVAEVCPAYLHRHMYQYDRSAAGPDDTEGEFEEARPYSRYWYLPWTIRHQYRSMEKVVKTGVTKFWVDPNTPNPGQTGPRPHYPPYAQDSLVGLAKLGPRDLVFSLGGLWMVNNFKATVTQARQRMRFQFVSLIYDLIPIVAPQYVPDCLIEGSFVPTTDAQLRESAVTLTISEHSKLDVLKYAQERFIPVGPVEVFTLGSDITPLDATAAATETQHSRPFVLSVGTIESRKNHFGMYQAWRKLVKVLGPDRAPDLVFAGKQGWHGENVLYMVKHDPLVKDKIIVKAGVGDRELDWLYKNCLFTLYPSLYEGWGLPVEESFIYGKMCVTTNVSSLPEVGGEFAEYVEPEDPEGIVRAVVKGLDPDYRRGRESLIREKYRANTWSQAVVKLQGILESNFSFAADRARRKKRVKEQPQSTLARAMSFFW